MDFFLVFAAVLIMTAALVPVVRSELRVRKYLKQADFDRAEFTRLLAAGKAKEAAEVAKRIFRSQPPKLL